MRKPENAGKLIGKGAFTKVWEDKFDASLVIMQSDDYAKEAMALGWFPECTLFPAVERIDYDEVSTYSMQRYEVTRSVIPKLDKHNAALYRALRKLTETHRMCTHSAVFKAFETLPDKFDNERECLLEATDAMANYGSDVCFEISPRNVAAVFGKLVLLDCFFMEDQLEQKREQKR